MLKKIILSLILIITFGTLISISSNIPIHSQNNSSSFVNNGVVDCSRTPSSCETPDVSDKYLVCLVDYADGSKTLFREYLIGCQPKQSLEGVVFIGCYLDKYGDNNFNCLPDGSTNPVYLSPQLFTKGSQFSVDAINKVYPELKLIYTPSNSSSQAATSSKEVSSSPKKHLPLCPPEGCEVISVPSNVGGNFLSPEELNKVGNTGGKNVFVYNLLNIVIFLLFALSLLVGFVSLIILIIATALKKKFWKIALIVFIACLTILFFTTIAYAYIEGQLILMYNSSH